MWSAYENPPLSGKYSVSNLPYNCSSETPVPCNPGASLDGIISYGEDSRGDIYVLAVNGLYRMVSPDLCNIECTAVLPPAPAPGPGSSPPGRSSASSIFVLLRNSAFCVVLALCALVWLWSHTSISTKWAESVHTVDQSNKPQSSLPQVYNMLLERIPIDHDIDPSSSESVSWSPYEDNLNMTCIRGNTVCGFPSRALCQLKASLQSSANY